MSVCVCVCVSYTIIPFQTDVGMMTNIQIYSYDSVHHENTYVFVSCIRMIYSYHKGWLRSVGSIKL